MDFLKIFSKNKKLRIAVNKKIKTKGKKHPKFWDFLQVGMQRNGYKMVYDLDHDADAVLMMHGTQGKTKQLLKLQKNGAKLIHRLDGIFDSDGGPLHEVEENAHIQEAINIADAIIYQSEYCREAVEKHLLPAKPECKKFIIFNGADEKIFTPDGSRHDKFGYDYMIVVTARWRKWKGLKQMVETFLKLDREDTVFAIIGPKANVVVDHPRIKYLGYMTHKEMARVYRSSDVLLYLPWFDWCPNSVIQAMVCGVPVVCSSRGGTKEFIGSSGIVVPSTPDGPDVPLSAESFADQDAAVEAINEILSNREKYVHPRSDLHITQAADNYLKCIHETIGIEYKKE